MKIKLILTVALLAISIAVSPLAHADSPKTDPFDQLAPDPFDPLAPKHADPFAPNQGFTPLGEISCSDMMRDLLYYHKGESWMLWILGYWSGLNAKGNQVGQKLGVSNITVAVWDECKRNTRLTLRGAVDVVYDRTQLAGR